ncbi:hypothetical protein CONPUDRAFT_135048 [Coniophora puteana RWD-64-598 SS2]|uniref:AMP-dependent synthetase/ligase domain-containing protein n=1 Tax=Coniophora puteana (strain RWD-64-598) TaxID=741705 RepID=A0A5M3N2Y4_CONPW|nr:uncharacterized protein CONPUDRAFT_135048 [Coniophora puteana RWD-64-598 SS2]EIW85235.1 hypothetical protein CONPUDRAFT_135048 [Coniophora puteana RWD-64-598 SS2]
MSVKELLVTDDLTVLLGLVSVTVFLLQNLYKPQPLVHPILLGRQSEAGKVRNPGESTVYRNYGTGLLGRFPVRPDANANLVTDLLKLDSSAPRTLWNTKVTNAIVKDRVDAFGTGLIRAAGLVPKESNVLILLNDGLEFLVADLALAKHSIASFTLSSPKLLSQVLESHPPSAIITDSSFLPHVLELIYDSNEHQHHTVIVTGELTSAVAKSARSARIIAWTEVEAAGSKDKVDTAPPAPSDVFTVSFSETASGSLEGIQFTHENFTAAVAAVRTLFPPSNSLSPLDTICSAHSLSTPFGRSIAYTALYESTSFATLSSTKLFQIEGAPKLDVADIMSATKLPIPSPTIAFLKPEHVKALSSDISAQAKKSSFLYSVGWRHKLSGLTEGFLTKDSLWDRAVFDGAREKVAGDFGRTIRQVIVSGGPVPTSDLTPTRIALSVPIVNAHVHPVSAGPVFSTQPLDLQMLPAGSSSDPFSGIAHVGAPSVNVQVKLVGVDDAEIEAGGDPTGDIHVGGPPVGIPLGLGSEDSETAWRKTGERGRVLTNGAFKVLG